MTDDQGRATVATIVPGCYDGRWPHIHFEVFALPEAVIAETCSADARCLDGSANLTQVSFASDPVFGDKSPEQIAAQTPKMTGDAAHGHTVRVTFGLA